MKIICIYIYTQDMIFFSHEQMFTDSTSNQIDTGTASHIYTNYLNTLLASTDCNSEILNGTPKQLKEHKLGSIK